MIARVLRLCFRLLRPMLRLEVLLTQLLDRGLDSTGFAKLQLQRFQHLIPVCIRQESQVHTGARERLQVLHLQTEI